MRSLAFAVCAMLVVSATGLADEIMLQDFDFADDAAAQAAWQAGRDTDPVTLIDHDDGKAVRIPCIFTRDVERTMHDVNTALDLSSYGRLSIDVFVDDPGPFSHFSMYFRSGDGWYGTQLSQEPGWNTVKLVKSDFNIEGTPAGWSQIDGIRLSEWKGSESDSFVAVDNLKAYSSDIAVIISTKSIETVPNEAKSITNFARDMGTLLTDAGITVDALTDEDILDGALDSRALAIFAYAPSMDAEVEAKAIEFIDGGGKVFAYYSLSSGLADALGVGAMQYLKQTDAEELALVAFEADVVGGLPGAMTQHSWNANIVEPARDDAQTIGWWEIPDGTRAGGAMILSDTGVYLGHVLTPAGAVDKAQAMTALIGHFVPDVWERKSEKLLARVARVGPYRDLDALKAAIDDGAPSATNIAAGEALLRDAMTAVGDEEFAEACDLAGQAHQNFRSAYLLSQEPRDGEFRAMWEHSGYGAYPGEGWAKSLDILKANGFNAIVPNMWWAGVAHYDSEYLPHSSKFEQYGDAIADCVEAAHARGIEVHAWKVNWNLATAPQEFIDELRAAERTMFDYNGNPIDWLCPSHPENYELELKTMVEVAEKYDVDGVHFDYIRYLGESVCYCDGCLDRFQQASGETVDDWPMQCYRGDLMQKYRDWRCDQITRLVRTTSEEVRKIKPDCKISAAVFSNYPTTRKSIGQDWLLWVQEGYLDFVCPMDYNASDSAFARTVARQVAQIDGECPIYPGIGASAPGLPADQMVNQIALAREMGAQGFTVFQLSKTTAEDHVLAAGMGILSTPTKIATH